ncbi:MAG TPA: hypothetical protein VEF04_21055 [Blastocatellia bacterium]|nr:hypothetical protein [Blastocatellia bacterium]
MRRRNPKGAAFIPIQKILRQQFAGNEYEKLSLDDSQVCGEPLF